MRIYLASRYGRREELADYRTQLEAEGHVVTSRWLNGSHEARDGHMIPAEQVKFATEDLADIDAADALILFTDGDELNFPIGGPNRPDPAETEQWKSVSDLHEVSSFGRVRRSDTESLLTGTLHDGYRRVSLIKSTNVAVHKLVAEAFIGQCPESQEIHHKDGDRQNNWVGNLQYVTHAENMAALVGQRRPGGNWMTKLTWNDVYEIRARGYSGSSHEQIARDYGVTDRTISNVMRGKTWREHPRGGAHVELGYALGLGKVAMVVGPLAHVFCHLPQVRRCATWPDCMVLLWALGGIDPQSAQRCEGMGV